MTKLEKNKMIVLVVGGILFLVLVIGGGFLLFGNKKPDDNPITDNKPIHEISPEDAENMYQTLTENCTGAMVWDLKVGDSVEIDNIDDYANVCQTENHFSKMIGYTYEEEDVILHVNVLKKKDNNLYKLDDTLVGEYSEDKLNELLDSGTTYVYSYAKIGDNYKLIQVQLMDTAVPEETKNEE